MRRKTGIRIFSVICFWSAFMLIFSESCFWATEELNIGEEVEIAAVDVTITPTGSGGGSHHSKKKKKNNEESSITQTASDEVESFPPANCWPTAEELAEAQEKYLTPEQLELVRSVQNKNENQMPNDNPVILPSQQAEFETQQLTVEQKDTTRQNDMSYNKSNIESSSDSYNKTEPKTAGTDIPIIPIAIFAMLLDLLSVIAESVSDRRKMKK